MEIRGPFDYLPLWAVSVATVIMLLLAVKVGFRLGCVKGRGLEEAHHATVGEIVGAMLGLLALLLAFTFDLAASRFDTRKSLVLNEANAIGTTYLRAGLLPEPERAEVRKLLRDYLGFRLAVIQSGEIEQGMARSEELHGRLWAQAVAAGERNPGSIVIGLFIGSLNEMIDLHAKRVTLGLRNRLPQSIWVVLSFVATLSIGTIGYHAGLVGSRKLLTAIPLVLTYSAVLWLIADLDRPQEGMLKVSQQALVDVRNTINNGIP